MYEDFNKTITELKKLCCIDNLNKLYADNQIYKKEINDKFINTNQECSKEKIIEELHDYFTCLNDDSCI